MLKAGKQLNTRHVGAVVEKPSKAGSNAETVVQGLAGRCCGYGKSAHAVRVVVQHSAAREYCYFWEDGVSVSKANNLEGGATDPKSAHFQGEQDGEDGYDEGAEEAKGEAEEVIPPAITPTRAKPAASPSSRSTVTPPGSCSPVGVEDTDAASAVPAGASVFVDRARLCLA